MVDRVELAVVDQVLDVRVLDRRDAVVGEQDAQPLDERVQRRRVRHHVVGDDHVGLLALVAQAARHVGVEELLQRRHAGRDRGRGLRRARVDAQGGHAVLDEVLEHVAVVGRDLDHEAVRVEPARRDQPERVLLAVREQTGRERGEVQVVVHEELLRRHLLADLHERAVRAEGDVERVARLGPVQVLGGDERVRQRQLAQVEEDLEPVRAAGAARLDRGRAGGRRDRGGGARQRWPPGGAAGRRGRPRPAARGRA